MTTTFLARPNIRFGFTALVIFVTFAMVGATDAEVTTGSSSVRPSAAGGDRSHAPVFSADGLHIAFISRARDLVTNDIASRQWNVYVHDLVQNRTAIAGVAIPASDAPNGPTLAPVLCADGGVVAFQSDASNLVANDNNRSTDIFVRELKTSRTRLISVSTNGLSTGNGRSWNPQISYDGRYVIFESLASDLVENDSNGTNDIFIRDLAAGTTTLVSVDTNGLSSPNGPSESPSISGDGRFVAFVSRGNNLVPGATNRLGEVYVRDIFGGNTIWAVASHLAAVVDPITRTFAASQPALSVDGRYVAFKSQRGPILRYDISRPTNRVALIFPPTGSPNPYNSTFTFEDNPRLGGNVGSQPTPEVSLSSDGRFLTFISGPAVMPSNAVFRTDFETLVTNVVHISGEGANGDSYSTNQYPKVEVVSLATGTNTPASGSARTTLISGDGSTVAFLSDSTNLVLSPQPSSGFLQLYTRKFPDGAVQLVSTNLAGREGSEQTDAVFSLDGSGQLLATDTPDSLVPGDLNGTSDIYAYDLEEGSILLVSQSIENRNSITPAGSSLVRPNGLSSDGRRLAFSTFGLEQTRSNFNTNPNTLVRVRSLDGSLAPDLPSGQGEAQMDPVLSADGRYLAFFRSLPLSLSVFRNQIVRRDLLNGTEVTFGSSSISLPLGLLQSQGAFDLSSDGHELVIASIGPQSAFGAQYLSLVNLETGASNVITRELNGTIGTGNAFHPAFSSNARWIAFSAQDVRLTASGRPGLFVWDRVSQAIRWLTEGPNSYFIANDFAFSDDSHFIIFNRPTGEVVLHDLLNNTNLIASSQGRHPVVSGDGRWTAFEQTSGVGYSKSDIMIFDRTTGTTSLISRSRISSGGGNASSTFPAITPNGRFVAFVSRASDLVANDTNGCSDIFVRDTLLGTTTLITSNLKGTGSANGDSIRPIIGADGRTLLFLSDASDLVNRDYNNRMDVFLLRLGGIDSDGDGLDDDWEMAYFNSLSRDGSGDFDGDGVSDRDEFLAGTSPTSQGSILRVMTLTSVNGSGTRLFWTSVPGRSYKVQFVDALPDSNGTANWQDLPIGLVTATTDSTSALDADSSTRTQRFYRVVLVP